MIRLENLNTDIVLELKHEMEVVWKASIHKGQKQTDADLTNHFYSVNSILFSPAQASFAPKKCKL